MRLILFIAWLFAEAWGIGVASDAFGGPVVFVLLLFIAAIGIRLIQHQGIRTVVNIQVAMQRGELPAAAMLDGLIVFIAGVLLVVPGFVSDGVALVLLFSSFRRKLARHAEGLIARQYPEYRSAVVIEGDYRTVTDVEVVERQDSLGHNGDRRE